MIEIKKHLIVTFIVILTISMSCEEVIDIELDGVSPVLVAEGEILLGESVQLWLSYTSDYFTTETPVFETNATVILKDDLGNQELLTHVEDDRYVGTTMVGMSGVVYSLMIEIDGNTYESSSQLYEPTIIIETEVEEVESRIRSGNSDDPTYELITTISDNSATENYYLFEYFKDGEISRDHYYTLESTNFSVDNEISYDGGRAALRFDKGTEACVRVYSIDKSSYSYFTSLDDLISSQGLGSTTPYNPKSNFTPSILGHFSAKSFVEQCLNVE